MAREEEARRLKLVAEEKLRQETLAKEEEALRLKLVAEEKLRQETLAREEKAREAARAQGFEVSFPGVDSVLGSFCFELLVSTISGAHPSVQIHFCPRIARAHQMPSRPIFLSREQQDKL